ncbi:alpha-mannosidase [bacterium SM23_57]|nr:MAG: alpha-mannosidase [bacterium SM23_57]
MSKILYLVCNSHLDPVWLWQWEEGLAETLSTFRTAAQFCDEFDGFVFCHNEALLYQWIETYEPKLFSTIRRLVANGKWHIMGGWYLQPDCNIPSGESLVRQILLGKRYFKDRFDVEPTVAVNFDPFGHTRGLVQALNKSGYKGYLFCRPDSKNLELPDNDFVWVGYDGSEVMAHRAPDHYNSMQGKVGEKITSWIADNDHRIAGLLLWGVGNHGGHAKPEDYFEWLEFKRDVLPRYDKNLNPWAVGCYTSMATVKQKHRHLENTYYATEKMLTNIALQGLINYPHEKLKQALEDLLFCQFHDILPGTSIAEVESQALQRLDHGLEICSRLRAKAFFSMLSGQETAKDGEFPLFVYNPHPYDIEQIIICEFQPLEPNVDPASFWIPEIIDSYRIPISFQLEKESCNIQMDQRKRVVFKSKLNGSSMTRFSCRLKEIDIKDKPVLPATFRSNYTTDTCEIVINPVTGLMDHYKVHGKEFLKLQSFRLLVMKDYPDPWGMKVRGFRDLEGEFVLLSDKESAAFAGVDSRELAPVRIIEDGSVRTVVEALFKYNYSIACIRYKIPKADNEFEVEVRVYWMEKDRMLKLSIPTVFRNGSCTGQVAYGVEEFNRLGEELVAQKWLAVTSGDHRNTLTVINDRTYGFDVDNGEIRLSLLRSPAYAGHPTNGKPIVLQDRFKPRIDQGEHVFRFWINAGDTDERLSRINREACVKNEPPMALCCYPPGDGENVLSGSMLSDDIVQLSTLKMAEDNDWLIIRLFEPTGNPRKTHITIPILDMDFNITLNAFEIKTIAVDILSKTYFEVDLLERHV